MKVLEEFVNGLRVAKEIGRAEEERERDAGASFNIDAEKESDVGKDGVEDKLVDEKEGDGRGGHERMRRSFMSMWLQRLHLKSGRIPYKDKVIRQALTACRKDGVEDVSKEEDAEVLVKDGGKGGEDPDMDVEVTAI